MAGIRFPRDFNLKNLFILTSTGVIDIKYIMNEISLQEDLFNNVVSGYVMVTEGQGYVESLSLTGSEFLYISFDKDGTGNNQISGWFRIYKIDDRKLSENMYGEAYRLHFCSEELFISEQYKISKSYFNTSIKDIILDICGKNGNGTGGDGLKNLKISKKLDFDDTKGLYSFVVPGLKPFDAINWLSTYAQPKIEYQSADMVFYENRDGFHFKSLQNLISNPNVYNTYHYDPKNIYPATRQNLSEELTNAITYEFLESFDTLKGVSAGVFANKLISVDVLTRKVKQTDFDYFKYKNNSASLNKYPIINNYINRNGDQLNQSSAATLKLVFSNFDEHDPSNASALSAALNPDKNTHYPSIAPNIYAETYIPYRTAQLSLLNYTRIRISVPGDPGLAVGKVINFDLLSNSPNNKAPNAYYSGKYLITAVRHLIDQSQYRTVMEIAKESATSPYVANPNGKGSWTKAIE